MGLVGLPLAVSCGLYPREILGVALTVTAALALGKPPPSLLLYSDYPSLENPLLGQFYSPARD